MVHIMFFHIDNCEYETIDITYWCFYLDDQHEKTANIVMMRLA